MGGIAVAITVATTGTVVAAMTGAIGAGMEIITATVTRDQTGGTGSGKEIN